MRISTAIATLLVSVLPAAATGGHGFTPFELLDEGSIIVPVTIGGSGPYRFVLDTGSSRTVIGSRLRQLLRLPVVARTQMVTPAGRDVTDLVRIDGLGLGVRPPVTVTAAVTTADRYAAGGQVDGLIGQDVLASAIYTIDYKRQSIFWHVPGDLLPGVRLPVHVRDNRVLVSLAQHDRDPNPLWLIPDSGSDGLVLFAHARHKLQLTLGDVGILSGLSGSRLARRVDLEALIVGNTRLLNPAAAMVESAESEELMGDGLLPLHVFSRVTFNVAEGYLIVSAR